MKIVICLIKIEDVNKGVAREGRDAGSVRSPRPSVGPRIHGPGPK